VPVMSRYLNRVINWVVPRTDFSPQGKGLFFYFKKINMKKLGQDQVNTQSVSKRAGMVEACRRRIETHPRAAG